MSSTAAPDQDEGGSEVIEALRGELKPMKVTTAGALAKTKRVAVSICRRYSPEVAAWVIGAHPSTIRRWLYTWREDGGFEKPQIG